MYMMFCEVIEGNIKYSSSPNSKSSEIKPLVSIPQTKHLIKSWGKPT